VAVLGGDRGEATVGFGQALSERRRKEAAQEWWWCAAHRRRWDEEGWCTRTAAVVHAASDPRPRARLRTEVLSEPGGICIDARMAGGSHPRQLLGA
jgi:hypothetical protein